MYKYSILSFMAACLLAIGFCIGATEHANIFSEVKWTDIATLLVTFFGFAFGFFTYFQWLSIKRKEDAYFSAKKYIASIDEIEELLYQLLFHYNHICPAPGLMVENKDTSSKRIEHLNNVLSYLHQARRKLYKSHRELEFWDIKLTDDFLKNYKALSDLLDNITVVCFALNNQLLHFIESGMGDNLNSVVQQKKRFDELYSETHKTTQKRVQSGFKAIFQFGHQSS